MNPRKEMTCPACNNFRAARLVSRLNEREQFILFLLVSGHGRKEIAAWLGLNISRIDAIVIEIFGVFEIPSELNPLPVAAVIAAKAGLI